jgi:DNA replication protein DnaC
MTPHTPHPPHTPQTPRPGSNPNPRELRDRLLEHFRVLRIPLTPEQFDAAVTRAEREHLCHLEFLETLIAEQADQRRERSIQRRIDEAGFREDRRLETFDWKFNAPAIDRVQIEELATGEFIRRGHNLVIVGQSGVGKSHIIQSVGRAACVLGYRVCYSTSAALLKDLTACLADQSLPQRLRRYGRFDLLIIDEFGFDKIERAESSQAASLLYKIIDARGQQHSTALVTNIGFEAWGEYLGDPPLAMAFLDRLVDGAIILKIKGKSYRAHRAKQPTKTPKADDK